MDLSLLNQGFSVMFIGMGTVFIFLCIMVFVMHLSGKLIACINKYFPEENPELDKKTKKVISNEEEMIAVALASLFSKTKRS